MAVEYKNIEFRLYEYLVQIQDMLTLLEADEDMLSKIIKKPYDDEITENE